MRPQATQSPGRRRRILAAIAVPLVAWAALAAWPDSGEGAPGFWRADSSGRILVMAHQGGAMERPSSSDLAFTHAAALGVDAFELDVALTADGVLAVIHDLTLDRTTDGTGRVRAKTYAEIRFLDAGYGLLDEEGRAIRDPERNPYIGVGAYVPSLDELFAAYPGMPMLVELKDDEADGALAAAELRRLIDAHGRADRTLVASFHDATMRAFAALPGPRPLRAASLAEATRFYAFHTLGLNALNNGRGYEALSLPTKARVGPLSLSLLGSRLRADATRRGLAVYYWTINDRPTMELLAGLEGVDGVITDRPSELIDTLERAGRRAASGGR